MRWLVVGVALATFACRHEKRRTRPARMPAVHRAVANACDPAPRAHAPSTTTRGSCHADAECTAGRNGICALTYIGFVGVRNECQYDACLTDADCPSGLCACGSGGARHRCQPATDCRTDADCGPGGACSPSLPSECANFGHVVGWFCHTAADQCTDDADCGGRNDAWCVFDGQLARWRCEVGKCQD